MQDAKKCVGRVVSKFHQWKVGLTGLLVAVIAGVASLASAQAPAPVNVAIPDIDYPGIATSMLSALTPAIVAAIGLGLSIWGISFIYRKFKSMGRG